MVLPAFYQVECTYSHIIEYLANLFNFPVFKVDLNLLQNNKYVEIDIQSFFNI